MAVSEDLLIARLTTAAIEAALPLSQEAGWNQTADDWRVFIENGRTFGLRDGDGRLVASAAALPYDGPFGFVAMVLVTATWRRRGVATRLVDTCIEHLRGLGLTPALDATPDGAKVYARQGFLPQFDLTRWQGESSGEAAPKHPGADPALLTRLDAEAFGASRPFLISDFLGRPDPQVVVRDGGFGMIRRGRRALQVGPVVAASEEEAIAILGDLMRRSAGPVFLDVPTVWTRLGRFLAERGFAIQRGFTRMALGRAELFATPQRLFAVAGPEFG
jgi:GNAT superfamily N-acetyltransferase